jgi:hypothetical protein
LEEFIQNGGLKGIFSPKKEEVQDAGENCLMMTSPNVIRTQYQRKTRWER